MKDGQSTNIKFETLWDGSDTSSQSSDSIPKIKEFALIDAENKYMLIDSKDMVEVVEASSAEEALQKAANKDIKMIKHGATIECNVVIDSSDLKQKSPQDSRDIK